MIVQKKSTKEDEDGHSQMISTLRDQLEGEIRRLTIENTSLDIEVRKTRYALFVS